MLFLLAAPCYAAANKNPKVDMVCLGEVFLSSEISWARVEGSSSYKARDEGFSPY